MSRQAAKKLYELRYYKLAAQDVPRMRSLVQDVFRIRVRHSRVIGYWATELGALNHVLHIWEYDSLAARKAARDAVAADQDWINRFLKLALPAFQHQENCVTKPLLGDMETVWSDQDFYKVLRVNYSGLSQDAARERAVKAVQLMGEQKCNVKGAFETVIGRSKEFTILQSSKNLDDLMGGDESFTSDPTADTDSKVLYPYQWSRWLQD